MKKVLFAATVLGAVVTSSSAFAADPLVQSFDWTGFYAGAQGGYGWGNGDHEIVVNGLPFGLTEPFGANIEGEFFGAHVGYDYQMDQMVLGIQVEGNWSGMDGFVGDTAINDDGYQTDVDWFGSVRGRLGFAPSSMPEFLFYVNGGLAMADVFGKNGDIDSPGNAFDCTGTGCASGSQTELGFTVGGGIAKAFQLNSVTAVLGLEYAYYDFGDVRIDTETQPFGVAHSFDVDTDFHTVRATLGLKF
jgi:outer membrane immunogenic protein